MVRGWDDFRETHRIAQTSWANACALDEMCEKWHATRKICAFVRAVRCCLYTPPSRSWQLPMSGREIWIIKVHGWWMCKTAKKFEELKETWPTVETTFVRISFLMLVWTWILCCLRLPFLPPLLVLPFFWLPLSPVLRIFPVLRVPPCRVLWPWRRRGWSRCRDVRLPVLAEPCRISLNCRIQSVVLACPHMHRNMRDTSTLFLLKAHQRTYWCLVIFSSPQWSCMRIWIVTSHEDHVFITISLAVRRVVLDVNRGEVVEVLDVSFSPPDRHLRSSVYLVVLPSADYWGISFCVYGFCTVLCHWLCPCFLPRDCNVAR